MSGASRCLFSTRLVFTLTKSFDITRCYDRMLSNLALTHPSPTYRHIVTTYDRRILKAEMIMRKFYFCRNIFTHAKNVNYFTRTSVLENVHVFPRHCQQRLLRYCCTWERLNWLSDTIG